MDSSGGREMTLIAKKPILPSWGGIGSPKQTKQPRKRSQSAPVAIDQSYLMGIAHKVQIRLASELQEASALLSQEKERSAAMKAEIDGGSDQQGGSFSSAHFDPLPRSPASVCLDNTADTSWSNPQSVTAGGQSSSLKVSGHLRHSQPNPTRYASPPRADVSNQRCGS